MMALEELAALPVRELVGPKAALMMWTTGPKMDVSIELLKAWGFHYRGIAFVWVKTRKSDGEIVGGRGVRPTFVKPSSEFVLAGSTCARGRPLPLATEAMHQIIQAPIGRHSEKPVEAYERLEELFVEPVRRLELFARARRSGWDAWGNELEGES